MQLSSSLCTAMLSESEDVALKIIFVKLCFFKLALISTVFKYQIYTITLRQIALMLEVIPHCLNLGTVTDLRNAE